MTGILLMVSALVILGYLAYHRKTPVLPDTVASRTFPADTQTVASRTFPADTQTVPLGCDHKFIGGFGGMGDAVVCCKCNYSKYPEALNSIDSLRSVIQNPDSDGRYYGHMDKYPYVIQLKGTSWNYEYAFNKDGILVSKAEILKEQENHDHD